MLILLPPSEGKHAPTSGPRYKMSALGYPGLKATRAAVMTALIDACSANPTRAAAMLGLGSKQRDFVTVNARLRVAPCAPAIEIYTGVLYEALDFGSLPAAARKRADARVAIASALFGLVRPSDPIPAYRLSGDVTVPGIGALASFWRPGMSAELSSMRGPILDLRSGTYQALGPLPPELAHRSFVGRVLVDAAGKRTVVSHHNKATKGRLVRAVLQQARVPTNADDVPDFLTACGFACEVSPAKTRNEPRGLDIVVSAV